ncbi:uncharacterized protein LOC110985975 [Acanthaster planci]|uniref:Uncharacterized protein LOC110985975 n=1 Tax=Acanthaster planci TaxID=133434 RepID=A0A8B7ZC20_ACAPL|nr:uncharacterized protein LOC110985975 [Acanthaster planci]XP_022103209.1 uncharacterized protein LOC110985975 [Acanthaster planci]
MDARSREKLCYHYDAIAAELNTEDVLLYLNGTVLSTFECDKISACRIKKDRAKALLDILVTRGPLAYQHFRYALKECYPHLVAKLDTECAVPEEDSSQHPKKIAFRRRDSLILNLKTDDILAILEKGGTLSKEDCNQVRAGMTKEDKARVLVNMIPERGPAAYRQFKLAVKAHQPKLADLLE